VARISGVEWLMYMASLGNALELALWCLFLFFFFWLGLDHDQGCRIVWQYIMQSSCSLLHRCAVIYLIVSLEDKVGVKGSFTSRSLCDPYI
jgi:hypothetical protein